MNIISFNSFRSKISNYSFSPSNVLKNTLKKVCDFGRKMIEYFSGQKGIEESSIKSPIKIEKNSETGFFDITSMKKVKDTANIANKHIDGGSEFFVSIDPDQNYEKID